jgi:lipopolysaccharide transport system ATP-binding protein
MTCPAIRVEDLGKQYRLGPRRPAYGSLRESIMHTVRGLNPFANGHNRTPDAGDQQIWALKDLSFSVQPGEVIGVMGRNGAGKSTLLKILSRITQPTEGWVELNGRVGSLLEVGTGFHPELTGRENIYLNGAILGMKRNEITCKFDEIVAFAELEQFIDTPVKRYSTGMYMRLAFAVAAHLETDTLLVDEVLAVGDAAFQKKCLGKMSDVARRGRTVIYVSHDMGTISRLCSAGLVLSAGRKAFYGSSGEAVDFYNQSIASNGKGKGDSPSHVIYEGEMDPREGNFAINRIEVLDRSGLPKPIAATWDAFVLRIWYSSKTFVKRASVVLHINTVNGSQLLLLSTQPDGTLPMSFEPGIHSVDCIIEECPLAAGHYVVGGGLAIPNAEWLWRKTDMGILTIFPRDVYGSGVVPETSRCLMAVRHQWIIHS